MESKNPNRFVLEEDDFSAEEGRFQEEFKVKRTYRKFPASFVMWTFFTLLFLGLIGFGAWYQFFRQKPLSDVSGKELLFDKKNLDRMLEKPYLPSGSLNPALAKCIRLYSDRYFKKAFLHCEEFVNTPAKDEEKSVALTVLGVLFDEAGRYPLAIERLKSAVRYDSRNLFAWYNLALVHKHAGNFSEARQAVLKAKELAPQDPRVALLAGNLLAESNDFKGASALYKEGIASNPDDPYLIYNLAVSQFREGKIPEAIENFRKAALASGSGQIAVLSHGHLGTIYYNREDLNGAEHHFREAVRLKPSDAKYLYNLGVVLFKKNKKEEASSVFQKALEAGANDPSVYRYIAESFEDIKDPSMALKALQKGLTIRPNDIDTLFQLADLYYNQGDLGSAEETFRKIISLTPGDTFTESALVNLGIILDDMERYAEAISAYEKALTLNPKNENAYYNLGIAYKNTGQFSKAIESWLKASAMNPDAEKHREAIADLYLENGHLEEAAKELTSLIRIKPSLNRAKLKLAEVYLRMKNNESSEKILKEVLNESKNGEEIKLAHRKLALLYSGGGEGYKQKAKDEAFRSAHIDPADMESKLVLVKVLIDSGSMMDREKAIDELKVIVNSETKPKIASQAYNYLGLCYYKNGEYKKALREFQNAVDLDPSLQEAYDNKRAARSAYEADLDAGTGRSF